MEMDANPTAEQAIQRVDLLFRYYEVLKQDMLMQMGGYRIMLGIVK